MITELMTDPMLWVGTLFVIACSYFNYRAGQRQGLYDGIDATLSMLDDKNLINLETDETGEMHISAKDSVEKG
jgi:hypothetical protein